MNSISRMHLSVLLGLALAVVSCRENSNSPNTTGQVTPNSDVVVYEGMPHPMHESRAAKDERRKKAVRELNGYPFYQEPLTIKKEDANRLSEILNDPATYRPFSGEKKCGGFHPDFAVEWSVGADKFRALICFGCGEVKSFRPSGESRYDLVSGGLSGVLKAYRKNRPVTGLEE